MPPLPRTLATLASIALGAVLPMLMAVGNKSAPATLGAAAVLANLAAYQAGYAPALWDRYSSLVLRSTTLLIVAFVLLCVVSLTWTIDPAMTRRGLVEALPELVSALMLAAAWPLVARSRDVVWLVVGLFGAAALICFEQRFGMPLHGLLHARGEAWDLKRSAIPPVLLLWPAVAYCAARGRPRLALGLGAAVVAAILTSHSGAPGFALLGALCFGGLARLAPRTAVAGAFFLVSVLLFLGPWTGALSRFLPPGVETALAEEHAAHRMRIWSAFEDRVYDHWVLGHGFNASYKVSQAPRPDDVPPGPDNDQMLNNHPHDLFLQTWVELGLLGAIAAAGVFAFVFMRLGAQGPTLTPPRLALLISVVGVGLVGLSAWQPWWLATIVDSLLWFNLVAVAFDA